MGHVAHNTKPIVYGNENNTLLYQSVIALIVAEVAGAELMTPAVNPDHYRALVFLPFLSLHVNVVSTDV